MNGVYTTPLSLSVCINESLLPATIVLQEQMNTVASSSVPVGVGQGYPLFGVVGGSSVYLAGIYHVVTK